MKQYMLLIIIFCISFAAHCEQSPWQLVKHPFDMEKAKEEINVICIDGYLPVGLDIKDGDGIYLLYIMDTGKILKKWFIHYFDNIETFEADVTYIIQNGWIPMDISKTDTGMYVLFINTDAEIEGWRISTISNDTSDKNQLISDFYSKGFHCYGISFDKSRTWYLFLKMPGLEGKKMTLLKHRNLPDVISRSIDKEIDNAWIPWGFMLEEKYIYILYMH